MQIVYRGKGTGIVKNLRVVHQEGANRKDDMMSTKAGKKEVRPVALQGAKKLLFFYTVGCGLNYL